MSVTANRVDASMENICKELHKFNNKIVDVCGSVKYLDNLLLKNNFDFKLLFQKGNLQGKFEFCKLSNKTLWKRRL